ncbi:MAG: response regulator [Deltaproteobacteria bacterium]|nr:MAG: response regulator [Deltaproteobacteria bacterium]
MCGARGRRDGARPARRAEHANRAPRRRRGGRARRDGAHARAARLQRARRGRRPRRRGTLPRTCREIRIIRSDARVILMSGYSEEDATGRLADAGAAAFLRKPFSVADLRSTMDRALAAHPQ